MPKVVLRELRSLWLDRKLVSTIELAKQILKEFPSDPSVLNILGLALASVERFEEAVEAIEMSIRISPEKKQYLGLSAMAFIHYQHGEYSSAEKWYKKTFAIGPPLHGDMVFASISLIKQGKFSEAKKYLHEITSSSDDNKGIDAHYYFGVILRAEGKYREAMEFFIKALQIDPDFENASESIQDIQELIDKKGLHGQVLT